MEPMKSHSMQQMRFLWPADLEKTGLETQDIELLEFFIRSEQVQLAANLSAHKSPEEGVFVCGKAKKFKLTLHGEITKLLPRTVYITNECAIVVLGRKDIGPGFPVLDAKEKETYAFDPLKGEYLIKRKLSGQSQELFYRYVKYTLHDPEKQGYGDFTLAVTRDGKGIAFDKCYPHTLATMPHPLNMSISIKQLIDMQDALRGIHSLNFAPSALQRMGVKSKESHTKGGPCFHGAITPRNIICETKAENSNELIIRLASYAGMMDFSRVFLIDGWMSPETVKWGVTKTRYKDLNAEEFNRRYGQKRDAWAFGLLIGSILQGGFHKSDSLGIQPNFAFILKKLQVSGSSIDYSRLAKISQYEIDIEIDELEQSSPLSDPMAKTRLTCWQIIRLWLRVNPDERSTLSNAYLTFKK